LTALFLLLNFSLTFSQGKRQMRAVWIATVNNIDWSPKNEFEPYRQREALLQILDTLQSLKINTVIFQVRPTADAFYNSSLEPVSRFLTGVQGVEPQPYYDPLQFVIEQAHSRNIEVHAWLNPYRVLNSDNLDLLNENNYFFKNQYIYVKYGNQYYFNPAYKETRDFLTKVVEDIVSHYDIEAVHIDDYFYPYPIKNEPFPDELAFQQEPRGFTNINNWRRNNVDLAIDTIYHTIKKLKPWVEFGVSPFGIWRNKSRDPKGSDTKALANYDDLYADVLKWMQEGKIDYVMPQLYWEIGHPSANFLVLAEWWNKNAFEENLYAGLNASNLGNASASKAWRDSNELVRQISLLNKYPNFKGVGLFSAIALMENRQGISDSLKSTLFKYHALTPDNNSSNAVNFAAPYNLRFVFDKNSQKIELLWDNPQTDSIVYNVVYYFVGDEKINFDNPENILLTLRNNCLDITKLIYNNIGKKIKFAVTSVNLYKKESDPMNYIDFDF
jgi:uncharacterized lipoprotein YddW (UPF0748 family)